MNRYDQYWLFFHMMRNKKLRLYQWIASCSSCRAWIMEDSRFWLGRYEFASKYNQNKKDPISVADNIYSREIWTNHHHWNLFRKP